MTKTTEGIDEVWKDFHESVNMTASQIEKWLDTEESKAVGRKSSDGADSATTHSRSRESAIVQFSSRAPGH